VAIHKYKKPNQPRGKHPRYASRIDANSGTPEEARMRFEAQEEVPSLFHLFWGDGV